MRISDWSSDVCSSDLPIASGAPLTSTSTEPQKQRPVCLSVISSSPCVINAGIAPVGADDAGRCADCTSTKKVLGSASQPAISKPHGAAIRTLLSGGESRRGDHGALDAPDPVRNDRSEEHT